VNYYIPRLFISPMRSLGEIITWEKFRKITLIRGYFELLIILWIGFDFVWRIFFHESNQQFNNFMNILLLTLHIVIFSLSILCLISVRFPETPAKPISSRKWVYFSSTACLHIGIIIFAILNFPAYRLYSFFVFTGGGLQYLFPVAMYIIANLFQMLLWRKFRLEYLDLKKANVTQSIAVFSKVNSIGNLLLIVESLSTLLYFMLNLLLPYVILAGWNSIFEIYIELYVFLWFALSVIARSMVVFGQIKLGIIRESQFHHV